MSKSKLVHYKDLQDIEKYYLLIDNGNDVIQHEIIYNEYIELKNAEVKNYNQELKKIKDKYHLLTNERRKYE
jgi:hypothetical protein